VGKVYRQKQPKTLVRIVGRPPLEATRYEMERLRCNGCGEVFTADEPVEAGAEKYDQTAAAMIAQLRYGSGVPFKRLERLEGNLGIPLPAATQWGVAEKAALGLRPVYDEHIRQAALGEVMHNDDTGMRILRLAREPADSRTGIFTSGIVSLGPGWKIALSSVAEATRVSLAAFCAQSPDLRFAPLMDMDFAVSCPLVRHWRLVSGSCPSTRTFDSCFFRTPPRGGGPCIITRPSPPSGWPEDLHLQAAKHAQHTTKPLCGSWVAWFVLRPRGAGREEGMADESPP
jgi:hypothetical protein